MAELQNPLRNLDQVEVRDGMNIFDRIPDPTKRDFISRAEGIKFQGTGKLSAVSPTAEDPYSIFASNRLAADAINFASITPEIAVQLANGEAPAAAFPELASATRDVDVATSIVQQLYDQEYRGLIKPDDQMSEVQARVLENLRLTAPAIAQEAVELSMAGLGEGGQDAFLSEVQAYLDSHDLSAPGATTQFIAWQYQQSQKRQQFEFSQAGTFGKVGEFFSQPFRGVSLLARSAFAAAASPQDAWYRRNLSLGQNAAISAGQDVGSAGYTYGSGTIDGFANIVLDPVAWAGGIFAGVKTAKTLPLVADASKAKLALNAFVPIKGANALRLPLGTRSLTARMGYLWASRTAEEMVEAKNAAKVIQWLSHTKSPAAIIDTIPEWKNAVGLVDAIAKESDPTNIKWLIKAGMTGGFDGSSEFYKVKANAAKAAQDAVRTAVDDAALNGATINSIDHLGGYSSTNGVWGRTVTAQLAPEGTMSVDDLYALREVDVLKSMKTKPDGTIVPGRQNVDEIKASILENGFDPDAGEPIQVFVDPRTNEVFLGDGNHRVTAMKELGMDTTDLNVVVKEIEAGSLEDTFNLEKVTDEATTFLDRQYRFGAATLDSDGTEKIILHDRAKVLDLRERTLPKSKTLDDFDAIIHKNGTLTVNNERMILRAVDADGETPQNVADAFAAYREAEANLRSFRNGRNSAAWVIKDMPTKKFLPDIDDFAPSQAKLFGGTSNANSWWKRAIKSRFFGQYPPDKINIANAAEGSQQLKSFLAYIGVKHDDIIRYVDEFLAAPFADRYGVVNKIVREAGEAIDHPLIKHNMIEFVNRQGIRGFGQTADGSEVLVTASKSDPSGVSAKPFIPSHMTEYVHLPDPQTVAQSLKRYKWSKSNGPSFTKGILTSTQQRRGAIADRVRDRLKAFYGDAFDSRQFNDEEIMAMAYASVGPTTPGNEALGMVAKSANTVHRAWRGLVSGFSIAMLAFRPLPWAGRVLLDENARGAFAGLPSIMRNPVRYLTSVSEARALTKAEDWRKINLLWARTQMADLRAIDNIDEFWAAAGAKINNLPEILAEQGFELDELTSLPKAKRLIASVFSDAAYKNQFANMTEGVGRRQQRRYQRSINIAEEFGIDLTRSQQGFTWEDDVPEILNQGWASIYSLDYKMRPVSHVAGQMTEDSLAEFTRAYQRNLEVLANDPIIKLAMRVKARRLAGESPLSSDYTVMMNTSGWARVQDGAAQWALENGVEYLNEAELVARYIDDLILPYVDDVFVPLLGDVDDTTLAARLDEIVATRRVTVDDLELNFEKNSDGLENLGTLLERLDMQGTTLPDQYAMITPHALMDEPATDFFNAMRRVPNTIIGVFGEDASQVLQRRGAWMQKFRYEKKTLMELGMNEKQASALAQVAASDMVNNVYYNLNSVTPFLKSMNQVIPFFTAAWEIAETWAYKVPMMQGGMGVGHANMIRKLDRVFDALRELGLVQYDKYGTPSLVLDREADTGNAIGDGISKNTALLLQQPLKAAEHLLNLGHAISGSQSTLDEDTDLVPDKFTFAVSSPVDPTNYGIGSAFDIAFAPQPVAHWALSNIREQLPFVSQHQTLTVEGSLGSVAEEHNVDPYRLIGYNLDLLVEELGAEKVNLLQTTALSVNDVDVSGLDLRMPNTSIWSRLVDEIFFPFGDTEDIGSVAESYKPAWLTYMFRSLGLWDRADDETGFLGVNLAPMTDGVVSGQVISSLRHLSAEEDVFSKMNEYRTAFYALADPYLSVGEAEIDENGELRWKGEAPANALDVEAAYRLLKDYSDNVLLRAIEDAASATFMRGMLSFVLPGTPRLFYEEEKAVDAYYQARQNAKAAEIGELAEFDSPDIDSTLAYINEWMTDPTGGSAMRKFVATHPELAPYIQGKTYWGPGGQPPLVADLDQYFDDVNAGLREAYPPDVWMQRVAIADNETRRQVAFIEAFGNDPYASAAASLADPQRYKEINEEFNVYRDRLEWEDDLNGGAYAKFMAERDADKFDIMSEALDAYYSFEGNVSDLIQMVEADPNMSAAEIKDLSGQLKGLRAGISNIRENFETTDQDYSWMAPYQRLRIEYFDNVYGPYLDALSELYDALDTSQSSEEQDIIWRKIAQVKDSFGTVEFRHPDNPEVVFPSPIDFQVANKSEVIRNLDITKSYVLPSYFLDSRTIDELVARSPQLEQFLPTTPHQQRIYDEYDQMLEAIDARYANGTGDVTYKQYRDAKENIAEQLEAVLAENGLSSHNDWNALWDVQKLTIADQLPASFATYSFVEQATAIQQRRRADGYKSVGEDDPGRSALTRSIWAALESDPLFLEDLTELGQMLYGESLPDSIIPQLFFNDSF